MKSDIEIIPSHKVNPIKWDSCIKQSFNGLIYASSDYLNHLADNWTAIVIDDYAAVMPVPWRKKFGIKYTYDVPFIQQSGLFPGDHSISLSQIIPYLFSICRYGDYHYNFANLVPDAESRTNFVLPLNSPYGTIEERFAKNTKQDINRALRNELVYVAGNVDETIDLFKKIYGRRVRHISSGQFQRFKGMCSQLEKENRVVVRKVTDARGSILAGILLLKDDRRLYNMINVSLPEGRSTNANSLLFSRIFLEFQQSGLLFDFEGSEIEGIREFYRKFGAFDQPYYKIHFNKLPWPLSVLKK